MKKLFWILVSVISLLGVMFAGKAGPPVVDYALQLQPGTVLHGINSALTGAQHTFRLISPSETTLLVGWPGCDGWCYTIIDGASKTALKWDDLFGAYVRPKEISDLVKCATENGWKSIDVRDIRMTPFAKLVADATTSYRSAVMSWFAQSTTIIPVFSLTPSQSFDIFEQILPYPSQMDT